MLTNLSIGYGRHLWDIRAVVLLVPSNVQRFNSVSIVYPIVIFAVKTSILLFYLRIFTIDHRLRWAVFLGIGVQAVFYTWYFATQIASVALCIKSGETNYICRHTYDIPLAQSIVNVFTDFYVLVLPVPRILKLQIGRRQWAGLFAIFFAGLATCIVSLARCILLGVTLKGEDFSWNAALSTELT